MRLFFGILINMWLLVYVRITFFYHSIILLHSKQITTQYILLKLLQVAVLIVILCSLTLII